MTPGHDRDGERRTVRARRVLVRAARVVLLVVLIVLGSAYAASAHNNLERSDPPNGGLAAIGRTQLTLWFGEPVDELSSNFTIRRTGSSPTSVPATATLEEDGFAVRLTTAPLQRGTYTVQWAVLGDDGHPTKGTVTFGAGVRPDGVAAQVDTPPSPWNVGLRLADLGGLLLAIGAVVVSGRVLTALGGTGRVLRPRVLRLGAAGALVCVVAAVATPLLRAGEQVGPTGLRDGAWQAAVRDLLLGSTWGALWLLRIVAGTIACAALWRCGRAVSGTGVVAAHPSRRPHALVVAAVALVVSAGLDAWAGHAATLATRTFSAVLAGTLHVLAAGVWAGGLLVVLIAVRPLTRLDPASRRGLAPAALRAYSPMAAVAAGVLGATGIYLAGRQVESLSTVSDSTYGTAVMAKALLLAVALSIAAYNTVVVNPALADRVLGTRVSWRPDPRRLATVVTVEAVVLVVAVAVAALMTTVPTAKEVTRAGVLSAPAHATVDGLVVTIEAVPTGSSQRHHVRIEAVIRPVAAPVTGVEVGVVGSSAGRSRDDARVVLSKTEEGRYAGSLPGALDGDWDAQLVLQRAGAADSVLDVPWSSGTGDRTTPLERTTSPLAVLLLMGVASVLVLVAARRRRTPGPTTTDAVVVEPDPAGSSGLPDAWSPAPRSGTATLVRPRKANRR